MIAQTIVGDTGVIGILALLVFRLVSDKRNGKGSDSRQQCKPQDCQALKTAISELSTNIRVQTEVLRAVKEETAATRTELQRRN